MKIALIVCRAGGSQTGRFSLPNQSMLPVASGMSLGERRKASVRQISLGERKHSQELLRDRGWFLFLKFEVDPNFRTMA